jgi:hypothetical protein
MSDPKVIVVKKVQDTGMPGASEVSPDFKKYPGLGGYRKLTISMQIGQNN